MATGDESVFKELRAFAEGEAEDLARLASVIESLKKAAIADNRATEQTIDVDAIWRRLQDRLARPEESGRAEPAD